MPCPDSGWKAPPALSQFNRLCPDASHAGVPRTRQDAAGAAAILNRGAPAGNRARPDAITGSRSRIAEPNHATGLRGLFSGSGRRGYFSARAVQPFR
jgi:hypothetical protein